MFSKYVYYVKWHFSPKFWQFHCSKVGCKIEEEFCVKAQGFFFFQLQKVFVSSIAYFSNVGNCDVKKCVNCEYCKVASSRPVYYSKVTGLRPKVTVHKDQISPS